jgi:putative glutamine amidotransferase
VNPRPVIGVTPCLDPGRRLRTGSDYWYLNRNYTQALLRAGAAPVLICPDTPIEDCLLLCDGLVLSGGGDLPRSFADPDWAGASFQQNVPGEAESLERIGWERSLLDAFAQSGRQVLGVCFGMQLMNLHFGGTLLTDLAKTAGSGLIHGSSASPSTHALRVAAQSRFFDGWDPPAQVSSSHRQGVFEVAPGFMASAWAEDGLVEAIESGPLVGVEWHPESDASAGFVYGRLVSRVIEQRG